MIRLGICGPIENIEVVAKMGFDYLETGLTRLNEIDEAEFCALRDRVLAAPIRVEAFNGMLPASLRVTGPDVNAQALHEYLDKTFPRKAVGRQNCGVRQQPRTQRPGWLSCRHGLAANLQFFAPGRAARH